MICMGRLSDKHKLTARTAPEIVEGVKLLLVRLSREGINYRGRALGIEGLVGAVVLDFLDRGQDEQIAVLLRRIPEVEAMLDGPGEVTEPPTVGETVVTKKSQGRGRKSAG